MNLDGTFKSLEEVGIAPPQPGDEQANNEYCLFLPFHGGYIDGMQWRAPPDASPEEAALMSAHKANHPPKGEKPNVDVAEFAWKDAPGLEARAAATNSFTARPWYWDSATNEIHFVHPDAHALVLPGVVLYATRAVAAGEELFLDYAFDAKSGPGRSSWYHPVET